MSHLAMVLLTTFEVLLVGAILLIMPRITRRGLLFGVYVGEEVSTGQEAARLRRGYEIGMVATVAATLTLEIVLIGGFGIPLMGFVTLLLLTGFLVCYLRAHFRARAMAVAMAPSAAAFLVVRPPGRFILPAICLGVGIAGGLFAIGYTWLHYDLLPEEYPTHFDILGRPDAWAARSIATVFLGPAITLFAGLLIGTVAILVANAKIAVRLEENGVSLRAQESFRTVMTRFISMLGLIMTAMLVEVSVNAIRVALGHPSRLHPAIMLTLVAALVVGVGGVIYVAIRYGQGGASLEREVAAAPLTDGLADNRFWPLGIFYVNREDPSILVEKRFGVGYTINLGNWKGIALLVGMLGIPIAILIIVLAAVV